MAQPFAGLVADLRQAAGLTQEELAERAGLSTRAISSIECGRVRRPHRRSLAAIGAALGLDAGRQEDLVRRYRRGDAGRLPVAGDPDVPTQLPAASPRFVGRARHLRELDALLGEHRGAAPPIAVIEGTAGVGKTSLALHWAHRVRDAFPDGQLYTHLHGYGPTGPADPGAVLAELLGALGVPAGQTPIGTEARAASFRSRLTGRRVLLVLDDARSAEQVRPLLPGDAGCAVVVTSRTQLRGLAVGDGARRMTVGRLEPDESRALLSTFVDPERLRAEDAATAGIIRRCDRLPLALSLVGDLLTRSATVAEVNDALADQRTRLSLLGDGEDERTDLRAVFSWSYRALDGPAASLFRRLGLHPGADFDPEAAAALAGGDATGALDTLVRAHLLESRRAGRYELHDLLRAYAADLAEREDPAADRRAAVRRLLDHYLAAAVAAAVAVEPNDAALLPDPSPPGAAMTADDAWRWFGAERANLLAAAGLDSPRHVAGLSDALWRYLHQGAYADEALRIHRLALDAAGTDPAVRARALYNLGTVYHRIGRTDDAVDAFTRAADAGTALTAARARDFLGLVHTSAGRLDDAVAAHRRALREFRAVGNRPGIGCALNNLGLAYRRLGRDEEALRHLRQARRITRQTGDRATEGGTVNNIGLIHSRRGDFPAALVHFTQALLIAREIGHREGEGYAASNVGSALTSLGRYREAAEHQRFALRLATETGIRVLEAIARNQLGRIALLTDDLDAARAAFDRAAEVAGEIGARFEAENARAGLDAVRARIPFAVTPPRAVACEK